MIFYFTGTGNSLYVARKLAAPGETVRSITEALEQDDLHVDLADGEALGFVFPVYFYTVSDPVLNLVRKMTVSNASYVYAVIVCGASIGPAGGFLRDELRRNGLTLSRVDPLIAVIRSAIDNRQPSSISGSAAAGKAMLASYHVCMGTGKFRVTDNCTGCGLCSTICPAHAIEMKDGRPVWTKKKCLKCCGCINRCPVSAIQYGRRTESRGRYVNPVLKG